MALGRDMREGQERATLQRWRGRRSCGGEKRRAALRKVDTRCSTLAGCTAGIAAMSAAWRPEPEADVLA